MQTVSITYIKQYTAPYNHKHVYKLLSTHINPQRKFRKINKQLGLWSLTNLENKGQVTWMDVQ